LYKFAEEFKNLSLISWVIKTIRRCAILLNSFARDPEKLAIYPFFKYYLTFQLSRVYGPNLRSELGSWSQWVPV